MTQKQSKTCVCGGPYTHVLYYLDAGSAMAGPDGALPSEMAADGIHLKAKYMDIWKQYLMANAVSIQ